MIDGAVYTQDGKVVLRYAQPIDKYIRVGEAEYVFKCQHATSLAFVDEAHVSSMLEYLGGCCGKRQKVISLASPAAYAHWQDGQGGR